MHHITQFHTYDQKALSPVSLPQSSTKILHLFLMQLAFYMLQNPHYDATQYAASCYTKLLKSKYFTQLPIPKHTQFAVISPVRYLSNKQPHQFSPQFHHFSLLLCPHDWSYIVFTEGRPQRKPVSFSHSCLPVCSLTYSTHAQQYHI